MPHFANTKLEKVICDANLDALGREDFSSLPFNCNLNGNFTEL